jgi:hypothetical protein
MLKRRYEIHLPLKHNDSRPVNPELFDQVRDELVAQFLGLSYQPNSTRGLWINDESHFEDELYRFVVDVEDTVENRQFLAAYKLTLRERFEQIEIYMVSYPVEIH